MATVTPSESYLLDDTEVVNKRPADGVLLRPSRVPSSSFGMAGMILRRPPPTVAQFSGTIEPAAGKVVALGRRGYPVPIELTQANGAGFFQFRGWYSELIVDYEFRILSVDNYVTGVYPVTSPEYNEFTGCPLNHNSAGSSRP